MINKLFITAFLFFAQTIYAQNTCDLFTIDFDFELDGYFKITKDGKNYYGTTGNYNTKQLVFLDPDFVPDSKIEITFVRGIVPTEEFWNDMQISYSLNYASAWHLASIPKGQPDLFPEAELNNKLECGYNRARIAWYQINTDLQRSNIGTPEVLKTNKDEQSNHFVREAYVNDLFPEWFPKGSYPHTLSVFNIVHYPQERGPYNYDTYRSEYSEGIKKDGALRSPETRWSGIMREMHIYTQCRCIDTLQFLLMDPFVYNPKHKGGKLYINIGNISEDVLKDSNISSESASVDSKVQTVWGKVSEQAPEQIAFSDIKEQDIGFDGLNDDDERSFFREYLDKLYDMVHDSILSNYVYYSIDDDVSNDNYIGYIVKLKNNDSIGILEAYKYYNGSEKNSSSGLYMLPMPECEDLNKNDALDTLEAYYQYEIDLSPDKLSAGINYISRVIDDTKERRNGEVTSVNWYEFKIPIQKPDTIINGGPQAGKPECMRLFFRDFEEEIVLRITEMNVFSNIAKGTRFAKLPEGSDFLMYPNPTDDKLYIDFHGDLGKSVNIYNLKGQLVYSRNLKKESEQESAAVTSQINNPNITFEVINDVVEIDVKGFENGLYIVHVNCADTTYTRKLIFNSLK